MMNFLNFKIKEKNLKTTREKKVDYLPNSRNLIGILFTAQDTEKQ